MPVCDEAAFLGAEFFRSVVMPLVVAEEEARLMMITGEPTSSMEEAFRRPPPQDRGDVEEDDDGGVWRDKKDFAENEWSLILAEHMTCLERRLGAETEALVCCGVPLGAIVYVSKNPDDGMGLFLASMEDFKAHKLQEIDLLTSLRQPFQMDQFAFDGRDVAGLYNTLYEETYADGFFERHLQRLVDKGCMTEQEKSKRLEELQASRAPPDKKFVLVGPPFRPRSRSPSPENV